MARPGYQLVDADYSQIELRLLAHLSNDQTMCQAFKAAVDIHTKTAMTLFDVPKEAVDAHMRRIAKTVNFSIVYGISIYGLSEDLNIGYNEAKQYIQQYERQYPEVRKYLDHLILQAKQNGYVETLFGRRRYIPELQAQARSVVEFGERVAMNTPVQGTAADLMRLAMVNVEKALRAADIGAVMICQVHDELILEVPDEAVDKAAEILRYEMEHVYPLSVPLKVDLSIGKNWYQTK